MHTFNKGYWLTGGSLAWMAALFLLLSSAVCAQSTLLRSPDRKFEAFVVAGPGSDLHFQVKETKTGRIVLTTEPQYSTPNIVKAGMFSPDSKEFGAGYHYGHKGSYTWVGIWSLETGKRVRAAEQSGWIQDISFVFRKNQSGTSTHPQAEG